MKENMQLISRISIIMLLTISLSGCFKKKCDCYKDNKPNALLETYFSNYKYGSQSWVYVNRNCTKKDSIYITWDLLYYGRGAIIDDEINCEINYWWCTLLRSKFLSVDTVRCEYSNSEISFHTFKDYSFSYSLRLNPSLDSLVISTINRSYFTKKESVAFPSGETYNEVINVEKRLWFAPNVGLIKFVSFIEYNKPDTFYLQKFYRK